MAKHMLNRILDAIYDNVDLDSILLWIGLGFAVFYSYVQLTVAGVRF